MFVIICYQNIFESYNLINRQNLVFLILILSCYDSIQGGVDYYSRLSPKARHLHPIQVNIIQTRNNMWMYWETALVGTKQENQMNIAYRRAIGYLGAGRT